jgi:hypothetical protein
MNNDVRVLERQEPETCIAPNTIFEPQHPTELVPIYVQVDDDTVLTYVLPMLFSGRHTSPSGGA